MHKSVGFSGSGFVGKLRLSFGPAMISAATFWLSACAAAAAAASSDTASVVAGVDMGRLDQVQSLASMVGKKVHDLNDHSVGKLQDVLLDLPRGEILAAVISPGGSGVIPVPPATFRAASKDTILVNADQKLFQTAPRLSQAQNGQTGSELSQAYQHFKQQPPEAQALVSGAVLTGKPVLGSGNETLGQVQDVSIDLPMGRILYVTIQPASGRGTEGKLFLAPPAAFKWDSSGKLSLPASREKFVAGPYFQKAFSTDLIEPELMKSIYAYYLPHDGAPKSAGDESSPAVATQSTAPTPTVPARPDSEITKAVMMEILNQGKVALRGDVQITTRQGRVKLAGMARSEKEKQCVVDAARKVVGAAFVDDTLLVKGKNTTASVNQ